MNTIILDDNKPFLIIGSSGQEKILTQEIVNKYNSIAINRSDYNVDIIIMSDVPRINTNFSKCRYFLANEEYKKEFKTDKIIYFKSEYKIISDNFSVLGRFQFTVTLALNFIKIIKPGAEVYLVGIDHNRGKYKDPKVKRFIERYKKYLKVYQTDFSSVGWNLEYKELIK